jgi:hypothetical protein
VLAPLVYKKERSVAMEIISNVSPQWTTWQWLSITMETSLSVFNEVVTANNSRYRILLSV